MKMKKKKQSPPIDEPIDSRQYFLADQERFADLSGDFNPVHLDSAAARREIFGEVVVHGVHTLLRALDAYSARLQRDGVQGIVLHELAVKFPNAIGMGQQVETFVEGTSDYGARLTARAGGLSVLNAELSWVAAARSDESRIPAAPAAFQTRSPGARPAPANPTLAELPGLEGNIELYAAPDLVGRDFPSLVALLGLTAVSELLALTRLVGMEAPGLRSTLSGFRVEFRAPASEIPALGWKVCTTDPRFSLVKLELAGPSIHGEVDTFRRPEPQQQPGMQEVGKVVRPGEFEGQCALVIGGSRGLGEVTARIVAAGGGRVLVTYYRGCDDAEALAEECRRVAGAGESLAFDSADPEPALAALHASGVTPTHIYYFASPKIFVSKPLGFNTALFETFAQSYVHGFAALHQSLRSLWPEQLTIFYPSTTALDKPERQLAEYSAAKAAGEVLCAQFDRFDKRLRVVVNRLPRTATDQTLTLGPYPAASGLDVMLPIVRDLHRGV